MNRASVAWCMRSDLEKEKVSRTKRPKRCRKVQLNRWLNHAGISFPDVGKAMRLFVRVRNGLPQLLAGSSPSTANDKSDHLPGAPTQGQPNPAFVFAAQNETPQFIQLQNIAFLEKSQSAGQRRQLRGFF